MAYHAGNKIPFAPLVIWNLWHQFPHVVPHLHTEIVTNCAHEIALGESDWLLADSSLCVSVGSCTVEGLAKGLDPFALVRKFWEVSPFIFGLLMTLAAAPNTYGKRKASKASRGRGEQQEDTHCDQEDESEDESDGDPECPDYTRTF